MYKRWGKAVIAFLCSLVLLILPVSKAFAAFFAFETQFSHEKANIAWLTDLVIKEDMSSVAGLAQRCELIVKPDYPYSDTPESFAEDVKYYTSFYAIDPSSARVAYLYFFDFIGSVAGGLVAGEISDEDVAAYLESVGIVYPDDPNSDELIMARALYTAMISGVFSGITSGSSLEDVMVTYLASLSGLSLDQLKEWMPDSSVLSLDKYITAASKLTLWMNGYDVSAETEDDEVFKLVAVMTLSELGIAADSSLSYDELKSKYTAVMLGRKYGVTVNSERLAEMIEEDNVPFYMLQLIGKKAGVSIREDNCTYEEAFELVAENSGFFDLEEDEFYADVYNYELSLSYKRSSIWVYPTAYVSGDDYIVSIDVDGYAVRNNYYTEVAIDPDAAEQTLAVNVFVTHGDTSSKCVYYIKIYQGAAEYVPPQPETPSIGSELDPFVSSESIVSQIMSSMGVYVPSTYLFGSAFLALPLPIVNVLNYMAPTFEISADADGLGTVADNGSLLSDEQYKEVLDQIGNLSDVNIRGIDGMKLFEDVAVDLDLRNYITFE